MRLAVERQRASERPCSNNVSKKLNIFVRERAYFSCQHSGPRAHSLERLLEGKERGENLLRFRMELSLNNVARMFQVEHLSVFYPRRSKETTSRQ
jgi:hypothetical protein